jgi:hypothetical protein
MTDPPDWDDLLSRWRRAHLAVLRDFAQILDLTEQILEHARDHTTDDKDIDP